MMRAPLLHKPQPSPRTARVAPPKCPKCGTPTSTAAACSGCAGRPLPLRRKLAIGASSDPAERQADRAADQVMAGAPARQLTPWAVTVHRHGPGGDSGGAEAPPRVHRVLAQPGRPLDAPVRRDMEASFGRDFSRVRIHDGSEAGQSARDVGASAWTVGSNIAFAPGHYAPDSSGGRRLLAHELAHVVQQGAAAGGEPQVLRRSLALNSTMEICRRSLTSRNFGVERGGLKVVLDVAPVDTSIVDCQDHPFWVTLTRVKDWDFDPDHGTCPARTGTSSLLEFGNVPKGEYYLGINRSFDHPYCCLEGGIRAYDVVVPQNSAGCSEGKSLSVMDIVHGALDVAGFVPVLGAVPDVINAVIYVAEGDFENAGLSVIAAVPGAGDAVKGTAMTTKVIIKVTEETAVTLGTKGLGQAIKEAKIVTKEGVKVEKAAVKEGASGTAAKTVAKTAKVPQKAHDTLAHIRKTGSPPKGYAGGRVFQNREGKLPKGGSYREYDVDPRGPGGRNAERIVVDEKAGKAWYTGDHYGSFTPM